MKRYLYFPAYKSDWNLAAQYILCGNPKIATLNPVSNASTYLWEQIEPNPLITPVIISPNNTSKNIVIVIPTTIASVIVLRVTLNGDTTNYKYVTIIPFLVDTLYPFTKGRVRVIHDNTLNNPVPLFLAPIPSLGPQIIRYTSPSQLTGVRFKSQDYRLGYTKGVTLNSLSLSTYIPFIKNAYYSTPDIRVQLNVNTKFTLLKDWINVEVFSQEILPIDTTINMTYPNFIADDYILSISKGGVRALYDRIPYLVGKYNQIDILNTTFTKGGIRASYDRVPYSVARYNQIDAISSNFTKGGIRASFTRTPYTSNIVG